ncbi:MAG: hypothetical protein V1857_01570 [archaeon]
MSIKDDVSAFLRAFTKPPQMKVLNSLAEKPEQEFTKTDIANTSGIGRTTLYRIWDDLEKMKAIAPSRKVGAVTLYRLNLESSVIQSLLSIRDRLEKIETAVDRLEDLRSIEQHARTEFGPEIPATPSLLLRLHDLGATTPAQAVPILDTEVAKLERSTIQALVSSGLIQEVDDKYCLTALGEVTAEGAADIWRRNQRQTFAETVSSLKVALDTVSGDIKKLGKQITS